MGYNGWGFFPLWDKTKKYLRTAIKFFFRFIPQRRSFPSTASYTNTTTESCSVYCIPQYNTEELWDPAKKNLPHCITQRRRFSSGVSHNGRYFPPLWDTTEEFFSIVGYNGRGFPPLWDTTEEVFFRCGIQRKKFFLLWDTMERNYTMQNDFFNLKCLSVLSNRKRGKISYLNSQPIFGKS